MHYRNVFKHDWLLPQREVSILVPGLRVELTRLLSGQWVIEWCVRGSWRAVLPSNDGVAW